jgi:hypothetical protein
VDPVVVDDLEVDDRDTGGRDGDLGVAGLDAIPVF